MDNNHTKLNKIDEGATPFPKKLTQVVSPNKQDVKIFKSGAAASVRSNSPVFKIAEEDGIIINRSSKCEQGILNK